MKIAIAIWKGRVSPVFDVARNIFIVDVENGTAIKKTTEILKNETPLGKASKLAELNINILICGAISHALTELLLYNDIKIISFIAGDVDDVLNAFIHNMLPNPALTMPGCWKKQGCICHRGKKIN